uniref:Uncharacterized protein n=1 Tax=Tetranychus urticae TaxID=32264 RepID=A0A158P4K5_TETUR
MGSSHLASPTSPINIFSLKLRGIEIRTSDPLGAVVAGSDSFEISDQPNLFLALTLKT